MKLNPRVKSVQPLPDYLLRLTFTNGEVRVYDVGPVIEGGGVFSELRNESAFRSVRPGYGSVQWAGGQDICPDTLYADSVPERAPAEVREKRATYRVGKSRKISKRTS